MPAKDDIKFQDKVAIEIVKKVEPAPVHFLTLPITTENTVLTVNDENIVLPAGQPTVAIEAHFPINITYGRINRVLVGGDPFVPKSINLQK